MGPYKYEMLRTCTRGCYITGYRDAEPPLSFNHFAVDILSDDIINESPFENGRRINGNALRTYTMGHIDKVTGLHKYTTPRPELYDKIISHIAPDFTPPILIDEHSGSATLGKILAAAKGHDAYARQQLLQGTFRGLRVSVEIEEGLATVRVLSTHLLPGEDVFRARLFTISIAVDELRTIENFWQQGAWDNHILAWSSSDGWMTSGLVYGYAFGFKQTFPYEQSADFLQIGDFRIDNFEFNQITERDGWTKHGRRVIGLMASMGERRIRFSTPGSQCIEFINDLLWRISIDVGKSRVEVM